jgi:hypothetical protein
MRIRFTLLIDNCSYKFSFTYILGAASSLWLGKVQNCLFRMVVVLSMVHLHIKHPLVLFPHNWKLVSLRMWSFKWLIYIFSLLPFPAMKKEYISIPQIKLVIRVIKDSLELSPPLCLLKVVCLTRSQIAWYDYVNFKICFSGQQTATCLCYHQIIN